VVMVMPAVMMPAVAVMMMVVAGIVARFIDH
jgi:hypothetical protein